MKTCFKCGETKALHEFYKHSMMADGHLGKCKECTKKDVAANYYARHEQYREYDRLREKRLARRAQKAGHAVRYRTKHPVRTKAQRAVAYALRTGKLVRRPCERCGGVAHAHHEDYLRPLDVLWLCAKHHVERHKELGTR